MTRDYFLMLTKHIYYFFYTFTATSAMYQDGLVEDLRATYNHKAHSIDFKLDLSSLQAGFINPVSASCAYLLKSQICQSCLVNISNNYLSS